MPTLALKIPPLLLTAIFAGAMWLTDLYLPQLKVTLQYQEFIATFLFLFALGIILLGVFSFKQARTTVNPVNPEQTSSLVVSGIYQITRNPMYLGFLLILVSTAVLLGNIYTMGFIPLFIWYMNKYQITHEEKMLLKLFGDTYCQYLAAVRRWI